MTKIDVLETVSYPKRRIKLTEGGWISVSPFVNLDGCKFGKQYSIELKLENGQWYVDSIKEPVDGTINQSR